MDIPVGPNLMESAKEASTLRARDLRNELHGSLKQRMEETKTVLVSLVYGQRPEVVFTGFWNGRAVKNAQNALARFYRVRRHKDMRPNREVLNHGESTIVKGDGNVKSQS